MVHLIFPFFGCFGSFMIAGFHHLSTIGSSSTEIPKEMLRVQVCHLLVHKQRAALKALGLIGLQDSKVTL